MTRTLRRAATTLLLLAAAPLDAQLPTLAPGLRVRLDARPAIGDRVVGTLMTQTPDSIVLASSATSWYRVPVRDVVRLDVHMGTSRWSGMARGFLLGGAIVGGAAMVGSWSATDNDFVFPIALTGAGVGAVTGLFLGSERWFSVFSPDTGPDPNVPPCPRCGS